MKLWQIDEKIQAVAPIHGVNSTGIIAFTDSATSEQKHAAEELMAELLPQLEVETV